MQERVELQANNSQTRNQQGGRGRRGGGLRGRGRIQSGAGPRGTRRLRSAFEPVEALQLPSVRR